MEPLPGRRTLLTLYSDNQGPGLSDTGRGATLRGGVCSFIGLSPTGSGPGLGKGLQCKKRILNEQINPERTFLTLSYQNQELMRVFVCLGFFLPLGF